MAKKKSARATNTAKKAVAAVEKAQRELELSIKNLKTAMGHIHWGTIAQGHTHGPGQGHPHYAKGHPHGAKGHPHGAKGNPHGAKAVVKGHVHSAS